MMFTLQNLEKRAEGLGYKKSYDDILSNFHCIHNDTPPADETECPLLSCAFAKKYNFGHVLASTCDDGRIIMLNTEFQKDDGYPYHIQEVNTDALFSVAWSDIDMKLITTSGNHSATLFDVLEDGSLTEINSFKAHTCTVKTACFQPHSSDVFATGGRDGVIYIWDCRANRSVVGNVQPDKCIMNSHSRVEDANKKGKIVPAITCVVFQDENKLISCADTDPIIKVWDLRKNYQQYMKTPAPAVQICPFENKTSYGYSHMVMNTNGTRLFASSTSDTIYCYNITSYSSKLEYSYTGHRCKSFYVKCSLSPDEKYLASTDSLNKVYIWKVNCSQKPIVMLDGIGDGLSDVSWCGVDPLKMATTSDHHSPWIWNALPKPETHTQRNPDGFAVSLEKPSLARTCKRTVSMASKLHKFVDTQTELSKIVLPNAFEDGIYQTHICPEIKIKSKSLNKSLNNWLTNLHGQGQQTKESITLTIRNRVSPKVLKSPGVQSRKMSLKRKRLDESPAYNKVTKYFKRSDENYREV